MQARYIEITCLLPVLISIATPARATPAHETAARAPLTGEHEGPTLPQDPCGERPWYCGVFEAQQKRALALYQEGNKLFDDSLFVGAVTKYRVALAHWDHPLIHYNLMLALVALERPIEAYASSIEALRYGAKGLQPEEYLRAQDYHNLLRGRIAVLEVTCDEPGAIVSLDGEPLFRAPGFVRRFVTPGEHELVAKKASYLTSHQTLRLEPEKPQRVHVAMLPADQAMLTLRQWERWRPWAMVGAGVGVGLLGTALEWRASANNRALLALFDEQCPAPSGCFADSYNEAMEGRAWRSTWYRRVGHGASIAGAAAALTGLVLVYLNRPEQIENPARGYLIHVSVAPAVQSESTSTSMSVQVDF